MRVEKDYLGKGTGPVGGEGWDNTIMGEVNMTKVSTLYTSMKMSLLNPLFYYRLIKMNGKKKTKTVHSYNAIIKF
jgi:hypothetical protein